MNGREGDLWILCNDIFSSVAMMSIEIPNRDTSGLNSGNASLEGRFCFADAVCRGQSVESGDGDISKIAKSHRPAAGGMVAGWSHQTERGCPFRCSHGNVNCRASSQNRVIINRGISRRIRVKIDGSVPDVPDVLPGVRSPQCRISRGLRFAPFPIRVQSSQCCCSFDDSFRAFRMSGCRVINARRIVDDDHGEFSGREISWVRCRSVPLKR